MSNLFAVDDLYETGWLPLDTSGCGRDAQGRWYPLRGRIERECEELGARIGADGSARFGCVTATWDAAGESGRCIASSEEEALIHALAQVRRAISRVQLVS